MKKKIKVLLITFCSLVIIGTSSLNSAKFVAAANVGNGENIGSQGVLFPANEIPQAYEENFYVAINNDLIKAIADFNDGKISIYEYKKICNKIYEKIDSSYEVVKLENSEKCFRHEIEVAQSRLRSNYYEQFESLTSQEIKLYAAHPVDALKAKSCAEKALKSSKDKYKSYALWQENGDAYRHAYWSALMTKKINRNFAYLAGLAHEGLTKGYNFNKQSDDKKMDIANNYSGRKIGTDYASSSDSKIASKVLSKCKKGGLKRIRTYTSSSSKCDEVIDGVMTNYVGYYVSTSKGGLK